MSPSGLHVYPNDYKLRYRGSLGTTRWLVFIIIIIVFYRCALLIFNYIIHGILRAIGWDRIWSVINIWIAHMGIYDRSVKEILANKKKQQQQQQQPQTPTKCIVREILQWIAYTTHRSYRLYFACGFCHFCTKFSVIDIRCYLRFKANMQLVGLRFLFMVWLNYFKWIFS